LDEEELKLIEQIEEGELVHQLCWPLVAEARNHVAATLREKLDAPNRSNDKQFWWARFKLSTIREKHIRTALKVKRSAYFEAREDGHAPAPSDAPFPTPLSNFTCITGDFFASLANFLAEAGTESLDDLLQDKADQADEAVAGEENAGLEDDDDGDEVEEETIAWLRQEVGLVVELDEGIEKGKKRTADVLNE
jgi:hypothetical protein